MSDKTSALLECYNHLKSTVGVEEPFEIVACVDAWRRYWKPNRVKIVLLAESHVHTSAAEFKARVNCDGLLHRPHPDNFVRFVYCPAYGENGLVNRRVDPNTGTPQYWKIFYACCNQIGEPDDFSPIKRTTPARDRIKNKIRLLEEMRRRGIWLVDASIVGLYQQGTRPRPKIVRDTIKASWKGYVGDLIKNESPNAVLCIGKGVARVLLNQLHQSFGSKSVHVFSQPQARLSAEEQMRMLRRYSELCAEYCR